MKPIQILLVEDDKTLGLTLSERLNKEGYSIQLARTIREARLSFEANKYDLVILDIGLPDGDGFEFAKTYLQNKTSPPFLFLTALSGAEERLKGFELGADEFIPKPFHLKELLLRVRHVLKEHKREEEEDLKEFRFQGYEIFFDRYEIKTPQKKIISITKKECEVLKFLIQNRNVAISRDRILDKVWGEDKFPTNRTVDNCIVKLRQVFGDKGNQVIQSVRGVGYKWVDS
ncbi:MAG: response regulator transcription factor [Leptospiraceae bacterium]|nr:response regulator transcription factor [Leptospiraceae bacterium]